MDRILNKGRKKVFILTLFLLPLLSLYSQIMQNPLPGVWANKQVLLLSLPEGSTAFYSLSEEDPETYGLIYDGPVLLDVTGDVSLTVLVTDKEGKKQRLTTQYSVKAVEESSKVLNTNQERVFMNTLNSALYLDYTAGDELTLPSSLYYSFDKESKSFIPGVPISLSNKVIVPRFLPLTIKKDSVFWRYIIKINPAQSSLYSRRDVPFFVTDWEIFTFKSTGYIYKIDGGWWCVPRLPVTLDRSKPHTIYWQSIEYSSDNSVKSFTLPPKPSIKTRKNIKGVATITCQGGKEDKDYLFGVKAEGTVTSLYKDFVLDTFYGDLYEGKESVGIYYDNLYQGDYSLSFRVNNLPPTSPIFVSSAKNGFSRDIVTLTVDTPPNCLVYTALSAPILLESPVNPALSDPASPVLENFTISDYKEFREKRLYLQAIRDKATKYVVSAYCLDKEGNKSAISNYQVIIDNCNYYFDSESKEIEAQDGTFLHPFSTFSQLSSYLNTSKYLNIYLSGRLTVNVNTLNLLHDVKIYGVKDAKIIFAPNSSLSLKDGSLLIKDCVITYAAPTISSKEGKVSSEESFITKSLFDIDKAALTLDNVEVSASFAENAILINSNSATVTVNSSSVAASSTTYLAALSGVNSVVEVNNSSFSLVTGTAILFTCQGGLFTLTTSKCSFKATMGRVCELFNTHSVIKSNSFILNMENRSPSYTAIYTDKKNLMLEYKENNEESFQ